MIDLSGEKIDTETLYNCYRTDPLVCQFFLKTGVCQYGPLCYKQHISPPISSTLLFRNMFKETPGIKNQNPFRKQNYPEPDPDESFRKIPMKQKASLSFAKFFKDVFPEFEKFGKVKKIIICNNLSQHLRGNVYVFYNNQFDAAECYKKMNGRFYAGSRLNVEFSFLVSGNEAKCSYGKRCPKMNDCNFIHAFHNPRHRSRSPFI